MLESISEMARTKAWFEGRLRAYHAACEARDWRTVDALRLEVVTACEGSLDAVAMAYRTIEEAARGGK